MEHQRVTTRFPTIEPADWLSRKIRAGEGNRTLVISLEGCCSIDALYGALNNFRVTPQITVEAIMLAVRERGLAALEEAANVERLIRCNQVARRQTNERITRLCERGSRR